MSKKAASKRASSQKPVFVVFGLDKNGRAKGARFSNRQVELALDAAMALRLEVFEAVSDEMQRLARKLPSGRDYSKKRPSLPLITKDLHKRLHVASGGLVRDQGVNRRAKLTPDRRPILTPSDHESLR